MKHPEDRKRATAGTKNKPADVFKTLKDVSEIIAEGSAEMINTFSEIKKGSATFKNVFKIIAEVSAKHTNDLKQAYYI